MGKKKSCQDLKVPRPLNAAETCLYRWVEEAVLTQPSVVESDSLPEFRRNFPLMEDSGEEGDYVLEAAGPSDRELFNRLRVRLPFLDFQKDAMTRCRVTVSQLHLNGGVSFSPLRKCACTTAFIPPSYFSSIFTTSSFLQPVSDTFLSELVKAACFLARSRGQTVPLSLLEPEVKDSTVYNLEPLEMVAFKFLVSLPGGLPKRNKFTCRWILDSSDAEVGKFLDDLLDGKMKKTKLDNLLAMMADPSRMGPRAVLPTGRPAATAVVAAASASTAGPTPTESSSQVPPVPTAPETYQAKKQSSKRERAKVVDLQGEEGLKEDTSADLQRRRRKKRAKEDDVFDRVLGDNSAWKHDVDPVKVAFPESFDYRKALDAGLTSAPVREALIKMPPEQLLGGSYPFSAKSLVCLQMGVETSLAAKVDDLDDQLSERTTEYKSALERIAQLEEDNGVLKTQLESSQLSLEGENKRSEAVEKQAESFAALLKTCQADLSKATEASEYWRAEWQKLGIEVTKMCQETLDICLDQVSHSVPT
ncbi:hypothetical protein PIB30_014194 [Stylosanthes scabra]|uniref:Uncharacterized protein n=1 Tax=Stylosanthes scabra TaxID=79078 RepID=A0ABU6V979_9FABA|nr:hypothetical protein [Stylosanthes scabra]